MPYKLARELDSCESGRDIASLSKQLRETMEEIEAIEKESGTVVEITKPQTALELIRTRHTREA